MAKSKSAGKAGALAAAGVAAAGIAAAGYYFYASKDAKSNRKIAAKWAREMEKTVAAQVKKVKNIDRAAVMEIVDKAAKAAKSARDLDPKELAKATKELKANWDKLVKGAQGETKKIPAAKKAVRKIVKKAVKNVSQ